MPGAPGRVAPVPASPIPAGRVAPVPASPLPSRPPSAPPGHPGHPVSTPPGAAGLPARICPSCNAENQGGMNFCRHCGTPLAAPPPQTASPTPVPGGGPDLHTCRRCGGKTQAGFAFCQHCGAMLPTAPGGAGARASYPPAVPNDQDEAIAPTLAAGGGAGEAAAAALRGGQPQVHLPASAPRPHPGPPPAAPRTPTPPAGMAAIRSGPPPAAQPAARPSWGSLYSVRRDGTDGERFPLSGEWVEIGRQSPDLAFDDPYLALRHARLEQQPGGGCRVVPVDLLNGVYRKIRGPHTIPDGTHILIGREVLRFELVSEEERDITPLVRFGVTMFGSPARKPWGRLSLILPSGGLRDVRHLHGGEVVLGREEGDIVFRDDEFLSRRHAVLRWQNNGCVLDDLKSSNGTFIRLRGPQPLEDGDVLRMGDQMFRLELGAGART